MLKVARILANHCWLWFIFFLISAALVLSAARILLPQLDRYHQQVEHEVSQLLGQDVSIARFEVGWHGLGPRLYLQDVKVKSEAGDVLVAFNDAYVDISLWSSLRFNELDFGAFTLRGLTLKLLRQADGSLSLEGAELAVSDSKAETETADFKPDALSWLWRQGQLAVENSSIQFRDMQAADKVWHFENVSALLRNVDQKVYLSGRLQLPESFGRELQFMLSAERQGKKVADWLMKFYLNGQALAFTHLLDVIDVGIQADKGDLDLQLWGQWRRGQLADIRAEFKLVDALVVTKENKHDLDLPYFSGQFVWQGDAKQWSVDIDQLHLAPETQYESGSRFHLVYQREGQTQKIEGGFNAIYLQQVLPLIQRYPALPKDVFVALSELEPRGEINNAFFRFKREADQPVDFFVQAAVKNGGFNAWRKLPGVSGMDGVINVDSSSGVIDLHTHDAVFDSAGLFRKPLPLASFSGRVAWQRSGQGLHLDLRQIKVANDDVQAAVDSRFYFPQDENISSQIDLSAQLERGDVAMLSRYLPVKIMSKNLVAWLDKSIVSGRLESATVVLKGSLRDFPFDQGEGRFEVRAKVADGLLDYLEAWPRLEHVDAELAFVGRGMLITGHRAKIFSSDVDQIQVGIDSLRSKQAVLTIKGRASGGTENVLRYLNESPFLFERYGDFLGDATASGQSVLNLNIDIPFELGQPVAVSGQVQLTDSALDLVTLGVDVEQINGAVAFDQQGLKAESVLAHVLGQPATVTIFPEQETLGYGMVFEAEGLTQYDALAQRLGATIPIFPYLIGESRWQARLHIPAQLTTAQPVSLRLETDLQGTALTLPDPLFKGPEFDRNFLLTGEFYPQGARWAFNYDDNRLSGLFAVPPNGDELGFRGELHFAGEAVLPERKGIRVAGTLASFSDEDWFPIIFPEAETGAGAASLTDEDSIEVNAVVVSVAHAQLFSQQFETVSLDARKEGDVWAARVDSQQLIGMIYMPEEWTLPLEAKLDYLYLPKFTDSESSAASGESAGERWFDPKILPPLRVQIKRFNYGGEDLGRLDLLTEKRLNGLSVERLQIESDFALTTLKGAWTFQNAQHNSVLEADMQIKDLGKLLTALDFAESVNKGEGSSQIVLRWPAPIFALETEHLTGSVVMDFKKGSVLDVDPGAGRLFGLLSVQALPRRLFFDFRDLGEGLAFDEMSGRFDIKSGDAYSRNFMLDGPTAKVELKGRVGLAARDYDQRIFVTPHITSGLPLIGAVTVGLGAGAAVLLVERLLKSSIDKATRAEYSITGSWDEPKIALVDDVDEPDESDHILPEILRDE